MQEGTFFRVGGTNVETLDIRFIVATTKMKQEFSYDSIFLPDLIWRLNPSTAIEIPAIKDRDYDKLRIALEFAKELGIELSVLELATIFNQEFNQNNVREIRDRVRGLLIYRNRKQIRENLGYKDRGRPQSQEQMAEICWGLRFQMSWHSSPEKPIQKMQ